MPGDHGREVMNKNQQYNHHTYPVETGTIYSYFLHEICGKEGQDHKDLNHIGRLDCNSLCIQRVGD